MKIHTDTLHQFLAVLALLVLASCESDPDIEDNVWKNYHAYKMGLQVNTTRLLLSGSSTTGKLLITTQCPWMVEITAQDDYYRSSNTWLSTDKTSGRGNASLSITATPNPSTTEARQATIIISNGISSQSINVVQQPGEEMLIVSPLSLHFPYGGGAQDISVESNVKWSVTSSVPSWISIYNSSSGFTIYTNANNSYSLRSANVTITGKAQKAVLSITQQEAQEPTVGALTVSGITKTSAYFSFHFSSSDLTVTECGICYSTSNTQPTTSGDCSRIYPHVKTRDFNTTLNYLQQGTNYYVRPYVQTSCGITYGKTVSFTTLKTNAPGEGDNPTPGY